MPARIQLVYRVIPAVHVRQLVKIRVPGKKASGCRIVIPRPHLHDPRVPVVSVAGSGAELVGGGGGTGCTNCVPVPIVRH